MHLNNYIYTSNPSTSFSPIRKPPCRVSWLMEGFVCILLRKIIVPLGLALAGNALPRCIYISNPSLSFSPTRKPPFRVVFLLAEMEGFEPPHAFRRLADFESAPFSRLGTSPYLPAHYISRQGKNQGLFASLITSESLLIM